MMVMAGEGAIDGLWILVEEFWGSGVLWWAYGQGWKIKCGVLLSLIELETIEIESKDEVY